MSMCIKILDEKPVAFSFQSLSDTTALFPSKMKRVVYCATPDNQHKENISINLRWLNERTRGNYFLCGRNVQFIS